MKKTLIFCLILAINTVYACDVCGSASSSFSLGMLPGNQTHFIGLRHTFRTFKTTHPPLFGVTIPGSEEVFTSTDMFLRISASKRFQLISVVPFVYNQQTPDDTRVPLTVKGIGDISLLGNYVFINTTDSLSKKFKQSGSAGLGLKMPLGNFDNSTINNRNMLPGSGSWDFLINFSYSIQKGSWGFFNESSFSLKTKNKDDFQFGNAFSTSNLAFYRWNINDNWKILPQLGLQFSQNQRDKINGFVTDLSFNGGTQINIQTGGMWFYKKWAFSPTVWIPIYQTLGEGYVQQKIFARFSVNYFIPKKKK
jgi:hypothetical protein